MKINKEGTAPNDYLYKTLVVITVWQQIPTTI